MVRIPWSNFDFPPSINYCRIIRMIHVSTANRFVQNHGKIGWGLFLTLLFWVAWLGYQAQQAPIVFHKAVRIVHAAPGGETKIDVLGDRRRSISKNCWVEVRRDIIDSRGELRSARTLHFSPELQGSLQDTFGDIIPIRFTMPHGLASGAGTFINDAYYTCSVWHRIFGPKRVTFVWPIQILNPRMSLSYGG